MTDRTTSTTAVTLTDRYVAVATRGLGEPARSDLAAELQASIADQIDARLERGSSSEDAERAVLVELGDPDKLAAGYADHPLQLIGPRYYLDWRRLLVLLLWIVLPVVAIVMAFVRIFEGGGIGDVIGTVVVTVLGVGVQLAFWVTLVFAILERTSARRGTLAAWSPDHLPELHQRGSGRSDLIATLIWLVLVVAAVMWDRAIGLAFIQGEWRSVLAPSLWPWWIAGLFAVVLLDAIFAIMLFRARGWTVRAAVINTILSLVFTVPALALLWAGRLVDSSLYAFAGEAADVVAVVVPTVVGLGIAIVAILGIIDGFLKARAAH